MELKEQRSMFPAFLIHVVVALIVVGLVLLVVSQIPMDPAIARIIRVWVIVALGLWLVYALLGLAGSAPLLLRR